MCGRTLCELRLWCKLAHALTSLVQLRFSEGATPPFKVKGLSVLIPVSGAFSLGAGRAVI